MNITSWFFPCLPHQVARFYTLKYQQLTFAKCCMCTGHCSKHYMCINLNNLKRGRHWYYSPFYRWGRVTKKLTALGAWVLNSKSRIWSLNSGSERCSSSFGCCARFTCYVSGPLVLSVQQASCLWVWGKGWGFGVQQTHEQDDLPEKHVTSQLQSILWLPFLQLLRVAFVASRS